MYTQIFLLVIVILLINLAPAVSHGYWSLSVSTSIIAAALSYLAILLLITLQNKWIYPKGVIKKQSAMLLTHIELIIYFTFIFFFLGVQTYFSWFTFSDTLLSFVSLPFYFFGLSYSRYILETDKKKRFKVASSQSFLLLPFLIPYFSLTVSLDFCDWFFGKEEGWLPTLVAFLLLGFSLLFLPWAIQKFWNCTPLKESDLHTRLENLCLKASFKHGGMRTWTVLPNILTAGIIGIIPRFRYVMFTPKLLETLPPEQIEAVLAHEIGHSKHKHLLMYPVIILGMGVSVALFFNLTEPFFMSSLSDPFIIFIPYAAIMWLYFRFVFGYFSRLFERQADLYVFKLGLPAGNLISALDRIASASGNIHDNPSWHHFSIKQRIDYLNKVIENPALIEKHHKKVIVSLILYFILLSLGIFFLLWYQ